MFNAQKKIIVKISINKKMYLEKISQLKIVIGKNFTNKNFLMIKKNLFLQNFHHQRFKSKIKFKTFLLKKKLLVKFFINRKNFSKKNNFW